MNNIQNLLENGIIEKIQSSILPGETYFIGSTDVDSSADECSEDFKSAAKKIKDAALPETRATAWFVLKSDGTKVYGQISVDTGKGSPQVIWDVSENTVYLEYQHNNNVRFSSSTEQLMANANPLTVLEGLDNEHGPKVVKMLTELGYKPILPQTNGNSLLFKRLRLENAND